MKGIAQGTQQDMTAQDLCFVNYPDIPQDDHTYKFFKVKVRLESQTLSQSFSPLRTEGSYTMGDLLTSHVLSSYATAISTDEERIDVVSDFYATEVEYLTESEAKRQMKRSESVQATMQPDGIPPLCEPLQKVKDSMVEAR